MANKITNTVTTSHAGASRGNASGSHRGHSSGSAHGAGSSSSSHRGHGSGSAHGAGSSSGSHRGHVKGHGSLMCPNLDWSPLPSEPKNGSEATDGCLVV
ncbi:hypothetical protein Tco_1103920 [Tanacetum coccineum]